jgi:hypothetical protein
VLVAALATVRRLAGWADTDDTALAVFCQHAGVRVKPSACAAAVQLVAADHPHHPGREYLDGLTWTGRTPCSTPGSTPTSA